MNRTREWRRSQNKRNENKTFKTLKDFNHRSVGPFECNFEVNKRLTKEAKIRKDTMKCCSCHMCGNARKHWNEKTIQEKIFKDIENSQD